MSAQKYVVALTPEQRQQAEAVARSYRRSERERKRARVLLLADTGREDGGLGDAEIAAQVKVCALTAQKVRRRFCQAGLQAALFRRDQATRKARALDGAAEAFLIATACGTPPGGQGRWTLRLLRERVIEAGYAEAVSRETVRQTLKKTNSSPG